MSDPIGRRLGDFQLLEQLGKGGGGVVYRAEQLSLAREAVVKVLARDVDGSPEAAERFFREARLASRLDHPYAAHVYSFGAEPDNTLWIAMELVRGTPLDQLIRASGPIPIARFVPLFERLCDVLNAAHEQGIVHRDIKPANVMVLQRGGKLLPKLLDLGIARGARLDEPSGAEHTNALADDLSLAGAVLGNDTRSGSKTMSARLTASESMFLTQVGSIVGTPRYMSPEQWGNAGSVDHRADIYSLAILAYEALTGRTPFEGKSLRALVRAHTSAPLPPLGDAVPLAVHDVLSKGAAKRADDRYQATAEFSAALRAASGLGVEPVSMPQLEDGLRENILAEAPQPIAEAVALLTAARAPRQAFAAAGLVHGVLLRYFGVIALSARAQVGPGAATDAAEVARLVERLSSKGLLTGEWLQLAQALIGPFSHQAEAHPLPELVRFLSDPSKIEQLASLTAAFDPLRADTLGDDELVALLVTRMAELNRIIEAASFIFDYALVVQRTDATRWMGARRTVRSVQQIRGAPPKSGQVVLVDGQGLSVLVLSPLVQCLAPAGNANEELFFFDGVGRHGAKLVAWPTPLELQDESIWGFLGAQGLAVSSGEISVNDQTAPYKGLSTFSTQDASNYFGREKEAEAFANRLRRESFLAVVGPSGTGKSSFILAGVLPLLPQSWRALVFRPGADPFAALGARAVSDGLATPPSGGTPEQYASWLADKTPPGAVTMVVVDQFEELVTLCNDEVERTRFGQTVRALSRNEKLRVVVTLRDDFLIRVQQLEPFRDILSNALQLLGTPAPADLERVVTEPARRVGYSFDDSKLPAQMVAAVANTPGALALLSFTSGQLWELRDRHLKLMRAKTYDALGGVGGALAHHAEATLGSMSKAEQALVREAFRHLVTGQGTRTVLSKTEAEEVLGGGPIATAVLEKLVVARLLVSSELPGGDDSIEIIHEALITAWPRLVAWQREDAELVRVRDALRSSARQWADRGRPSGLLWRKEALVEYQVFKARFAGRLTALEEAFGAASLRDERRARGLRTAAVAVTIVSLLIGVAVVLRAFFVEKRRYGESMQEQARTVLLGSRPADALLYADASRTTLGPALAVDHILGVSTALMAGPEKWVGDITKRLRLVKASRDGRFTLGFGVGEVALFETQTSKQLARWHVPCYNGAFSPTGDRIMLACWDRSLRLISVPSFQVREIPTELKFQTDFETSADGRFIAASVYGGVIGVFDWDGRMAFQVEAPGVDALSMVFSPVGGAAVLCGMNEETALTFRGVQLVDENGKKGWRAGEALGMAESVAFSPDGKRFAAGFVDGTLAVFDIHDQRQVWVAQAHVGEIWALRFSADGQRLLTAGLDGFARVWNADVGQGLALTQRPDVPILNAMWVPGDREFLIACGDGVVRRINATTGQLVWEYFGHTNAARGLALLAGSNEFVSGAEDGSIWRWSTSTSLAEQKNGLVRAIWGHQHRVMATNEGFEVRLANGTAMPVSNFRLERPEVAELQIADDGSLFVIADDKVLRAFEQHDGAFAQTWSWSSPAPMLGLAISHDGTFIAMVDLPGKIHVFSKSGQLKSEFPSAPDTATSSIAFDSTNRLIANSDQGVLFVVDPLTLKNVAQPVAHKGYFVLRASTVPGHFMTFGHDKTVKVWSEADWSAPVAELRGLPALPFDVLADQHGKRLAVIDQGGSFATYDLSSRTLVSQIRLGISLNRVVPNLAKGGVTVATALGEFDIPTFFSAPSTETIERLKRCRLARTLTDGKLTDRPPEALTACP